MQENYPGNVHDIDTEFERMVTQEFAASQVDTADAYFGALMAMNTNFATLSADDERNATVSTEAAQAEALVAMSKAVTSVGAFASRANVAAPTDAEIARFFADQKHGQDLIDNDETSNKR